MLNCKEFDCKKECDAKSKYDDIMQTCTDFKAFVNDIKAEARRDFAKEVERQIFEQLVKQKLKITFSLNIENS